MGGPAIIRSESGEYKSFNIFDNFNQDYPFYYKGKKWLSSEQAYQASKFQDKTYKECIRTQTDPVKIYIMGQNRDYVMVENFDRVKSMYKINLTRILQHDDLKLKLKDIKGFIFYPGSDSFWGTNGSYPESEEHCNTDNINGQIHMRIRELLV